MTTAKSLLVLILLLALAFTRTQAITVEIDLGPSSTLSYDTTVPFDEFNGTPLLGQNLSVDFLFANAEFVRLFTVTKAYETSLILQTDGSDLVGYLGGTGYLLDEKGKALHTPQDLGSASSSAAWMGVALYPLWSGELGAPLDGYGIHYDLTLPLNPSVAVSGGRLRLQADAGEGPFGIGPGLPPNIIPEGGRTLLFLGIGLIALQGIRMSLRRHYTVACSQAETK